MVRAGFGVSVAAGAAAEAVKSDVAPAATEATTASDLNGKRVLVLCQGGGTSGLLANALAKAAKERGISKVRICCDHYNIASAKTIQSNGGVLEDEMFDSSDGMLTQRYWIENR